MKKLLLIITAITALNFGANAQKKQKQKLSKMDKEFLAKQPDGLYAKFETNRGNIFALLEYKQAPLTVANFIGLAEGKLKNNKKAENVPYYDGLKFHRVIPGFMIQGGCPSGNGTGDPGYKFNDELDPNNEIGKKGYKRGVLAMANSGQNTNGSQFFIMHKDYGLPLSYNIYGIVVSGIEVVDSIATTPKNGSDLPNQDQVIQHITILRKGKEAEAFDGAKTFEAEKTNAAKKATEAETKMKDAATVVLREFESGKTTASGLKYIVIKEGTGATPVATSNVKVHYTGTFLDGKVFDSSVQRGQPIDFGLNQVIKGWTEGVQLMKEGAKYKFYIPYNLAYGDQGAGGAIPPRTDLIFEVELIKIN